MSKADIARIKLGSLFAQSRKSMDISAEAVAQELDLESVGLLFKYEENQASIPLHHIYGLANIYGLDPEIILCLIDEIRTETGLSADETSRLA